VSLREGRALQPGMTRVLFSSALLFALACDSTPIDTTGGAGGSAGNGGTGGVGAAGAGGGQGAGIPPLPTDVVPCLSKIYQCGDLVDNDGDGLVDSQDPDCLGPCQDNEAGYYGNIPGQDGNGCILDCYWDYDSGSGNDGCYWNHKCDPNEVAPDYYPEPEYGAACEYDTTANTPGTGSSCDELYADQPQACYDYCGPLTPNGCDCFGCCELPAGGGKYVWLGSEDLNDAGSCTAADVADPTKCHPCLPVAACLNGCGHCELCIGKTELPPDCMEGPPECPDGVTPCGTPDLPPCPVNFYCTTGCCQPIPS